MRAIFFVFLFQLLGSSSVLALSHSVTIILDPGHGGRDPGAVRAGVTEKALNLDIARRVETLLKQKGYRVVMTRRSDQTVSLGSRVALANRYQRAVVVSIHCNASKYRSAHGVETFYCSSSGRKVASANRNRSVTTTAPINIGNQKSEKIEQDKATSDSHANPLI